MDIVEIWTGVRYCSKDLFRASKFPSPLDPEVMSKASFI